MRRNVAVHVDQRASAAGVADGPDATRQRVLPHLLPEDHPQLHEDARQKQKARVNALARLSLIAVIANREELDGISFLVADLIRDSD